MTGAPDVFGVWIDHTGQGAVGIRPCGGRVYGHVVWMQKATDARGQPVTDAQNPDRARRATPMCGLQIIGNLVRQSAQGRYDKGWIYNPEDGSRYDVDLKLGGRDQLLVHGYMGMRFLGETSHGNVRRTPWHAAGCDGRVQSAPKARVTAVLKNAAKSP